MVLRKTCLAVLYSVIITCNCYPQETRVFREQERYSIDDIYEMLRANNHDLAFIKFRWYVETIAKHPVAYYQLGLISSQWMNAKDPLTQYDEYTRLADDVSRVYLPLAKHFMTDKLIKECGKYLDSVQNRSDPTKVTINEFQCDVNKRINEIKMRRENIAIVYHYFTRSVHFYNSCIDIYKQINSNENSIKNLYFENADSVSASLKIMSLHFDSTEFYFNKYKQALKKFPIKTYNQTLRKKDIIIYHLDGISNTDFLKPEITIWDYKKWVLSYNSIITSDIAAIRTNLDIFNQRYASALQNYTTKGDISGIKKLELPRTMRFVTMKYDYNSPAITLVDYFIAKKDLIIEIEDNILKVTDKEKNANTNDIHYFSKNIEKLMRCDSMLRCISNISEKDIKRYNIFFKQHFSSSTDIDKFIKSEKQHNELITLNALSMLIKKNNNAYAEKLLKEKFPKSILPTDTLFNGAMLCKTIKTEGNTVFACGYTNENNSKQGFWATVDTSNKIAQFKRMSSHPRNSEVFTLSELDGKLFTISNGGHGDSLIAVHSYYKNAESKRLLTGNNYETAYFDKLNNSIVVVTNDTIKTRHSHHITHINTSSKNTWTSTISVDGAIMSIIPDAGDHVTVALKDNTITILRLNTSGNVVYQKTLTQKSNIKEIYLEKIGDNSYSIAGTNNFGSPFFIKIDRMLSRIAFNMEM